MKTWKYVFFFYIKPIKLNLIWTNVIARNKQLFLIFCYLLSIKDKDQYGNEVQKMARPLPVEYLLLDVPTSSPLIPLYTFPSRQHRFPIENRLLDKHLQDFATFHSYMQMYQSRDFLLVCLCVNDKIISTLLIINAFLSGNVWFSCLTIPLWFDMFWH